MEWIGPVKDFWWLLGILAVILAALWRLAIRTNLSKERLEKVAENEKQIKALKAEITGIKDDVSDIKENQEKQGADIAAILLGVQSMMAALTEKGCDIGPAREKFNDHLAKR